MKSTPAGWPRMSSSVHYDDPRAAIDWLCRAFGFELRLKVEGGTIEYCELGFGGGLIMVSTAGEHPSKTEPWRKLQLSPKTAGGHTQAVCIFVDDADAHCAQARASGADIVREPRTDDYGDDYWSDRSYGAIDPEGHLWWFMQRIRDPKSSTS
jgi:uncharacterized glyoxalase superfamily protein PhnB